MTVNTQGVSKTPGIKLVVFDTAGCFTLPENGQLDRCYRVLQQNQQFTNYDDASLS